MSADLATRLRPARFRKAGASRENVLALMVIGEPHLLQSRAFRAAAPTVPDQTCETTKKPRHAAPFINPIFRKIDLILPQTWAETRLSSPSRTCLLLLSSQFVEATRFSSCSHRREAFHSEQYTRILYVTLDVLSTVKYEMFRAASRRADRALCMADCQTEA